MSSIKVEVVQIEDVRPHSNADTLELATVKGWQMVVRRGQHTSGDRVVYFEQGTALPREVADRFGVTKYLSEKTDINGERALVVHRVKLRGEPSFGLAVAPDDPAWEVGRDVSAYYGATKFMPPVKVSAGDVEQDDPRFPAYTDIENMRSYPRVFQEGELVEATEKVHGTNSRVGFVVDEQGGERQMVWMAGSRSLRRKRPEGDLFASSVYWLPWAMEPVRALLERLYAAGHQQAVLYGEIFGRGVQSYDYNEKAPSYRAFDLMIDGRYVDREVFYRWCELFEVATVPVIYRGAFSLAAIRDVSDGDSLVGGQHGREGVVVRPLVERNDPAVGRVILKYVGDVYLFGQKQDFTDQ
ncbi:MAG: RNA ligase (ATP) [Roseiflexaceae bacterium]